MSVQSAGTIPAFSLNDRLRKAREHAGLEQAELAARIGVNRNTIGNAERGSHAVRKIVINTWAMATGVSLEWLETGKTPDPSGPGAEWRARRDSNPQPSDLSSWRAMRGMRWAA